MRGRERERERKRVCERCAVAPAGAHTGGATRVAAGAPPFQRREARLPARSGAVACREPLRCGATLHGREGRRERERERERVVAQRQHSSVAAAAQRGDGSASVAAPLLRDDGDRSAVVPVEPHELDRETCGAWTVTNIALLSINRPNAHASTTSRSNTKENAMQQHCHIQQLHCNHGM